MTPSLVLALIASFITVPLVWLHSLLAWQYSRVIGYGTQKNLLHAICTNFLRVNVLIWLAASVAGLVVVSQQAASLPDDADGGHWKVGVSCALHRAVVIVAVLSFITICIYFCSRELCDRPYDVSLLGVYNQSNGTRDGSVKSKTSWDSESTLKNEILHYCRCPDAPYGAQAFQWSSDDTVMDKPVDIPNIQRPPLVRAKPQLTLSTSLPPETAEVRTVSPGGTVPSDPVSRTSTVLTSRTANDSQPLIAELPGGPEVPQLPAKFSSHKRQKSSMSSLRRLLPKSLPISLPLSADPQIKALSNPNVYVDLGRQTEKAFLSPKPFQNVKKPPSPTKLSSSYQNNNPTTNQPENQEQQRTYTMSSDDAPEVVPGTQPEKVTRPGTAHLNLSQPLQGSSINHPHYLQNQSRSQSQMCSVAATPIMYPTSPRPLSTAAVLEQHQKQKAQMQMQPPRRQSNTSRRYSTSTGSRHQSAYQSENAQIPRHIRSKSQQHYHRPFSSHFNFNNYPIRYNINTVPRRHDVEIIYPSTRRSRSSTYGGIGSVVPLDSIKESRASFDEVPGSTSESGSGSGSGSEGSSAGTGGGAAGSGQIIDGNSYRGTNWTSMAGSGC